jgi:uncharacterized protein GlcG (DUF336 family)
MPQIKINGVEHTIDADPQMPSCGPFATSNNGRVMIFAGVIPLRRGGAVVGAIGVSGGNGDQDQTVATAGAAAFSN